MIHVVTVFFPPPGVAPWKARHFLLERRLATIKTYGQRGAHTAPLKRHRWKTRQKNYLFTEISVWYMEKHDLQARNHMPPKDDK